MKKNVLFVLILLCLSGFLFAEENSTSATGNNQTNNQNVVVNVNLSESLAGTKFSVADTHALGFGLTTPIYGTYHNLLIGGKEYTKKVTGINWLMGYTWRTYSGNGLPKEKGGAFYFEFYTMSLIVPFVGAGYDYRISENALIGVGFPDIIHGSIFF